MPDTNRNGIVVLSPVWNGWPENPAVVIRGKNRRWQPRLTQKRTLKMKLKLRRGTLAPWENHSEMSEGLVQRISVRDGGWPAPARQLRPQPVQLPPQSPAQPIHRFQGKGQPQFFRRRLERKSRQHFHQPPPHERSRQRVTRQNISQDKKKSPPATPALPTVGTKHPLASESFSTSGVGIIAQSTAVPVQTASAAAMRTRRLLEGKSWVFNS
jgi:hypothetical protein